LLISGLTIIKHLMHRTWVLTNFSVSFKFMISNVWIFISDSRFMSYLPSILATATMLHVIKEVEPRNQLQYQTQLMAVLKTNEVCLPLTRFLCFIVILNLLLCEGILNFYILTGWSEWVLQAHFRATRQPKPTPQAQVPVHTQQPKWCHWCNFQLWQLKWFVGCGIINLIIIISASIQKKQIPCSADAIAFTKSYVRGCA
jgi:hypothetical protein